MFDLLDLAKRSVSGSLVNRASEMLGESPDATRRGLDAALPAALGGFIQRGSTPEGASNLLPQLKELAPGGEAPDLNDASAPALAQMANRGSSAMGTLFAGRSSSVVDSISRTSGLRPEKASSLLGLSIPLIGGLLGKEVFRRNLDAKGLSTLLSSQRELVSGSVPSSVWEGGGQPVREVHTEPVRRFNAPMERGARGTVRSGRAGWVPLAVAILLLLVLLSWWSHRRREHAYGGAGRIGQIHKYTCGNGPSLTVEPLSKDQVKLSFQGQTYELNRVSAPAGDRFTNGDMAWMQTGHRGVLSSGGNPIAKDCVLTR